MPKYVIEREMPGVGNFSPDRPQAVSPTPRVVLCDMGPKIEWVQSYISRDKFYCVYIAPNEEVIRERVMRGSFPANKISEVRAISEQTPMEAC